MSSWLIILQKTLESCADLKPKVAPSSLTEETRFKEDMGFDSLAMAAFFYELQDRYPKIDEAEAARWKKISDCIQTLSSHYESAG